MSKCNGGNQNFSFRRMILQSVHFTDNTRNRRFEDAECGLAKQENMVKVKSDINSLNSNSSLERSSDDNTTLQGNECCTICFLNVSEENPFFSLELCSHKFCVTCLLKYLKNEISESRTDISCPQCTVAIHPNNIEVLLKNFPDVKLKYEDFMIRRYLVSDPDSRWCPAPDCSYAVIATGCASCPEIRCERPSCGMSFCYHCKAIWHPDQTCDSARSSRQKVLGTSDSFNIEVTRRDEIKPCPRCHVLIVKMNDGSCNHMACSLCGAEFCWLCMKEVSDLHYLSPSGCTFWGKKPWSRKKKIVWQIGTLIGAPVGIALLAGIAIPSIVIGIPVWAGRKLLNRYKSKSRKRRNMSVVFGVAISILIAPILAGLAIAIGVPILLFYVYCIVPVSLFRAGCGNSGNENLKFDVNFNNEIRNQCNFDIVSIGAESKLGDISIGEVSLSAVNESILEASNGDFFNDNQHSCEQSVTALAGSIQSKKLEFSDVISAMSTPASEICTKTAHSRDNAPVTALVGSSKS